MFLKPRRSSFFLGVVSFLSCFFPSSFLSNVGVSVAKVTTG